MTRFRTCGCSWCVSCSLAFNALRRFIVRSRSLACHLLESNERSLSTPSKTVATRSHLHSRCSSLLACTCSPASGVVCASVASRDLEPRLSASPLVAHLEVAARHTVQWHVRRNQSGSGSSTPRVSSYIGSVDCPLPPRPPEVLHGLQHACKFRSVPDSCMCARGCGVATQRLPELAG